MNDLPPNSVISDLQKCKKMFTTMIDAINEYIQEPKNIRDKHLRKSINDIKYELHYFNTELDFYVKNISMIDNQILINLRIEINNITTKTHQALKNYRKYLQEGDF